MRSVSKVFMVATLTALLGAAYAAGPAGAFGGNSVATFCEKAVEVQNGLNTSTVDPDDVDSIKAYARKTAKGLNQLAKVAPTKALRKTLKKAAKNYAKIAKSGDLSENTPGQVDAQLEVQEYIATNCTTVPSSP